MRPSWSIKARAAYYKINKATYLKNERLRSAKKRALIHAAKDKPCMDCHIRYPLFVMDFDHKHRKAFNIGELGIKVSEKRLLTEIEKCVVVCANCHRLRTHAHLV